MDPLVALAVIGAVLLAAWLWRRGGSSRQAEMRLRRICLGNERQMEQLLHAEMERAPGITRSEAARRAVMRYERDNR